MVLADTQKEFGAPGQPPLLLFDGVCNFCNDSVRFIVKRDRGARFFFAPLQSELGRKLLSRHGLDPDHLDTMVLLQEGQCFTHSQAALEVAKHLGWGFHALSWVGRCIPAAIRDACYIAFTKQRYRWFGKSEQCMVPSPELKRRFVANLQA